MSERLVTLVAMRPALKPGLLPVWRNRDTLQVGIDPRRAVALTGMRGAAALLGLLDGSRDRAQILAAAEELSIPPEAADRVITLLAAAGALHDFPASTYQALPHGLRSRLAPELATAALAHGDGDGGARILARRQGACISVHGLSRVGLSVASLLTAAGIGVVVSAGQVPGSPADLANQGLTGPAHPAARHGSARRSAGRSPGRPAHADRRPDLVILADCHRREMADALARDGIAHLSAAASEAIGIVGPMVLPGRTACLRCLDLTRAERDPAWPMILAQLTGCTADPPACDAVLAAAVAAQATAQALFFIDRATTGSAVTNGTLELVLPDWQWRRADWEPHHRCGCGRRGTS